MTSVFAHLHARSGFSYGYGVATPEELVEATEKMDVDSIALTDRDGLYGIPRFLEACGELGISAIVGAEVSIEGGGHLVLLAEGMEGYRSLSKLITSYRCASKDRRKPLCPLPTLFEHAEDLVCLTGAIPFGLLPRLVLSGEVRRARKVLGRLQEAFGQENVFIELTDDRTARSRRRLRKMALFARQQGVPILATNEVTYLRPEDHRLHEVLVAASNLSSLPGPGYRPTDRLYLKTSIEMRKLFGDYPEALKYTAEVSERCSGTVKLTGKSHMPAVSLPEGETPKKRLTQLVMKGAKKRYGRLDEEVQRRLRRELSCIFSLGFASYFLLAHEARGIAKEKGIPVTGRGSAANSLVAYCLGLSQPEPFFNRLLFERFLHEHREDTPDVDLDLCSEGRDEVRDELIQRYERYGVAVAATANTLSLRGAMRVAARALGHPPERIDLLSRHVPRKAESWEEALSEPAMRGHPLREKEKYRLLLELSSRLRGRLHQAGTHLGGLVVGNEERHLSELVPLEPSGKGLLRCQYDKDDLEYVGLPKLDLLGLKMHTALSKAGELVSKRLGKKVNPYEPPPRDKETYRLIRSGKNAGMFQLESPGQMNLSTRLKPRRFSDLVAQISLFRPGPVRGDLVTPYVKRRRGLEPYSVPIESLKEILRPTYGVLIFQEQVLEVAHAVAGFSLAEGDLIRRAMTRDRGPGAMRKIKEEFVKRAVSRGVPEGKAREVFEWMEGFSVYGFSAAHAASFASLSYASAYMRCHYPAEFFCALLNAQPMGFYSPRVLLNEARRIGIDVLLPDIHLSGEGFTVEEDGSALRVGLEYCKGLSEKAISSIASERCKRLFVSVADLYQRTWVERDSLQNLIKGGFLDGLSGREADRLRLLGEIDELPKNRTRYERQPEIPLPHPASWWSARENRSVEHLPLTQTQRERMEWETLFLNVSRHPLLPYRRAFEELGVTPSEKIRGLRHGSRARAAGLIECLQSPPTKSGKPVWFLVIEDEWGLLQATIFRSVYHRYGHLLHQKGAFLLEGRVENTPEKGLSFLTERVHDLQEVLAGASVPTQSAVSQSRGFLQGRPSKRTGSKGG